MSDEQRVRVGDVVTVPDEGDGRYKVESVCGCGHVWLTDPDGNKYGIYSPSAVRVVRGGE